MATTYTASPCPCGHTACKAWHVSPVAAIQGVQFDEAEARDTAAFLNLRAAGLTAATVEAAPDMLAALRSADLTYSLLQAKLEPLNKDRKFSAALGAIKEERRKISEATTKATGDAA